MSETMEELPSRELVAGEQPDFPEGTLRIGETEHCCHEVAIRRLSIFERTDGTRRQVWDIVAEFIAREDAEICLAAMSGPTEVMLKAAKDRIHEIGGEPDRVWRVMIDAARG